MATWEQVYKNGTVYTIMLEISNAVLRIKFCNTSFNFMGQQAREIVTTRPETVGGKMIRENIVYSATSMFNESEMVLKMYKDSYSDKSKTAFVSEILRILL